MVKDALTVDKYRVIASIGESNYAQIYKIKTPDQQIRVLKIARNKTTEYNELIVREYNILSQFKHPNIIAVHDFNTKDGKAFFTLDYTKGKPINKCFKGLSDGFCRAFIQVINGLSAFHNQGFVHGDIKPEHLLYDEQDHQVIIIDFGFAGIPKQLMEFTGTLGYIAPEVISGTVLDQRSDLYSLGIILFEILSGSKFKQTIKPIASIPEQINNILARLVAKDPALRPPLPELHRIFSRYIKDTKPSVPKYKISLPNTGFVEIPEIIEALKSVRNGVMIINGGSGAGKSRLLNEMRLRYLAEGYNIFFYDGVDKTNFLNGISRFLKIDVDIFSNKEDRLQIYENIHKTLIKVAKMQNILIIIDDVDRLSDYELGLLRYLGYGIGQANIVILVASVPDARIKEIGFPSYDLRPFTCPEIEILLKKTYFKINVKPNTNVSPTVKFAKWLYKQSGGLPLFIVEIMKTLNENGLFRFVGNKWELKLNKLYKTAIPKDIDELLRNRITSLNDAEITTLELLAIVERPVAPSIISHLIPKEGDIAIERLKGMGLVKEDMKDKKRVVSMPHQILAKIVTRQIKRNKASQLRGKLIRAMEGIGTKSQDYLLVLARLCDAHRDVTGAYKYAKLAADNASKIYDYDSAILLHEIALRSARKIAPHDVPSLLIETGNINQLTGNNNTAIKYYQKALKDVTKKDKYRVLAGLGRAFSAIGDHKKATEYLGKSLLYMPKKHTAECIKNSNRLAYSQILTNRLSRAKRILSNSLKSAKRIKNYGLVADTMYYEIILEWSKNNISESIKKAKELLQFAKTHHLPNSIAYAANILGMLYQEKNEPNRVQDYLALAIKNFEKRKISHALLSAMSNQASIKYWQSDFDEANEICLAILNKAQQTNNRPITASAFATLASINKNRAIFDRALELTEKALRVEPTNKSAIADTVEILCIRGHIKNAVSFLRTRSQVRKSIRYNFMLALCYAVQGNTAGTKKLLDQGLRSIETRKTDIYDRRFCYATAMQVYYDIKQNDESLTMARQLLKITNPQNRIYSVAQAYIMLNSFCCGNTNRLDMNKVYARLKSIGCIYDYAHIRKLEIEILEKKGIDPEENLALLEHLYEITNIFQAIRAKREIGHLEKIQRNMFPLIIKAYSERAIAHKYLNTFSRLAELISEKLGDETFIEDILDLIVQTTHAERGALFLRATDGMKFSAGRNIDQTTIKDAGELSKTVIAKMDENRIIYTQDALTDPDFNLKKSVVLNKIRSILCLPLAVAQNVVGALYLDSRIGTKAFSTKDMNFLSTVSKILASVIERSIVFREAVEENILLKTKITKEIGTGYLIGNAKSMKRVYKLVNSVAHTNSPVLLVGETGTGKGMLARLIHTKSRRHAMKFRTINCGTIPETLLESELFGYKKGSFTGAVCDKIGLLEEAHCGTVFLDEITNTSASFQAKLLEAIEDKVIRRVGETRTRKIDVRFLFATNKDLEIEVEENRFRKDLYYRVNVFTIEVPPLRERTSDIPILAQFFCERYSKELNKNIRGLSPDALRAMTEYFWPGNVRELQNVIERTVVLARDEYIKRSDVGLGKTKNPALPLSQIKKEAIMEALAATDGNVKKAARMLGINRKTIQRYLKKYGLRKLRLTMD